MMDFDGNMKESYFSYFLFSRLVEYFHVTEPEFPPRPGVRNFMSKLSDLLRLPGTAGGRPLRPGLQAGTARQGLSFSSSF